jgi:predicted signal transduction protein with EAL and GGDEF domain
MDTPETPQDDARPALLPASLGPISRRTFRRMLDEAAAVATTDSAPVLVVVALDGLDERRDDVLLSAIGWQFCEVVGDGGMVCRLGSARLAVMVGSDGPLSDDALATGLLGTLMRPMIGYKLPQGARLGIVRWGRHGNTAEALFAAAAYALRDATAAPVAPPGERRKARLIRLS